MKTRSNLHHIFVQDLGAAVSGGLALQVYSDGGLRGTLGAAAFAIFLVYPDTSEIALAVVDAVVLEGQNSAFAMEVIAADRAIEAVGDIQKTITTPQPRVKRIRFLY